VSQKNVDLVLQGFRLIEANDFERWRALWHPECRATAPPGWPEQGPFDGRDAIVAQFKRLTSDWEEHHFDDVVVEADSGEWVVVTFRWCTRGVASGMDTHFDMSVANRVQNGKFVEAHFRWNREEALEAAGLSE
jgi:ketosteroid isomerase-like protein